MEIIKEFNKNKSISELKKELKEKEEELKEKEEKINNIELHNKILVEEIERVKKINSNIIPVIYIYNIDARKENPELKIGCSKNYYNIIKSQKKINKYGKIENTFSIPPNKTDIKELEKHILFILDKYKINKNIFRINVKEASLIILNILNLFKVLDISNKSERENKMHQINNVQKIILEEK